MGAGVQTVGMGYFWYGYDQSHWMKRAAWFPMVFIVPIFGAVLYYFFVYRRSPVLERTSRVEGFPDSRQLT